MTALNLRPAPLTVVISLIALFGWGLSMTAQTTLTFLPAWALVPGNTILSFIGAVLLTSLFARPIGAFFASHTGRTRDEILGNTATVTTGRVDHNFGQAEAVVGTDHLLIQVRCPPGNGIKRGEEVLIVDYDTAAETYVVEPLQKHDTESSSESSDSRERARMGAAKEESWEA